jgi:hypothetical protein
MWLLVVAMLVVLVLAGTVMLYVAYPHRGEDVPHVPWVGRLLRKGVDNVPTLDNTADPASHADRRSTEPESGPSSLALDLTSLDHGRPEGRRRG